MRFSPANLYKSEKEVGTNTPWNQGASWKSHTATYRIDILSAAVVSACKLKLSIYRRQDVVLSPVLDFTKLGVSVPMYKCDYY